MNGKAKDKKREAKAKKKEIQEAQLALHKQQKAKIDSANALEDALTLAPAFRQYNRGGVEVTIEDRRASVMSRGEIQRCFDLTKANMETFYDEAQPGGKGWDDRAKWKELSEDDARFILARSVPSQEAAPSTADGSDAGPATNGTVSKDGDGSDIVAFVHYRFEIELEEEVCYIWELQVDNKTRSKGLGRFLMQLLELVSRKLQMAKMMCTCFKANARALSFYKDKLKYVVDHTSPEENPDEFDEEEMTYEILSKSLPAPGGARPAAPSQG